MLNVISLPSRLLQANCYAIYNNYEAIIIDPCCDLELMEKKLNGIKVTKVLITHGHFDHIQKLGSYLNLNIKFYMHKKCLEKIEHSEYNLSSLYKKDISFDLKNEDVTFVNEGDIIDALETKVRVLSTFGHTDCSLTFIIDNMMFTGDFLFKDSIGRYDLYSANSCSMLESIKKVKKIKEDYVVYPGHGEETTLKYEIENNYYFK